MNLSASLVNQPGNIGEKIMMTSASQWPTLTEVVWPDSDKSWLRATTLAVAGSLLLTLSAKTQIPFLPVPLTFQTLVVLLIGFSYGPRLAFATVMFYLLQGAMGLPVFAGTPEKGIGLAYLMGPTGGFLVGFALAAAFCGVLAEKGWDRSMKKVLFGMLMANAIIYASGLLWLGTLMGWDKPILQWGLLPFIPGDVFKIVIAMLLLPTVWKFLKRNR